MIFMLIGFILLSNWNIAFSDFRTIYTQAMRPFSNGSS